MKLFLVILEILIFTTVSPKYQNSAYNIIQRIFDQCDKKYEVLRCLKLQAVKIADKAISTSKLGVIDGITVIKFRNATGKSFKNTEKKYLEHIPMSNLNNILRQKIYDFLTTHDVEINIPTLLEEGRKKKGRRYIWPLIAAFVIKSVFMAASYQGIAVMSGAALILGKITLILSAILGLKKLVSYGKNQSTTLEIVKHPHYTHSHSHSSSYEEDDHNYHHRSSNSGEDVQERIYSAYVPKHIQYRF